MFCLTVPKNFVGEPFLVSEKILVSKAFMHKRGVITIFRCINKVKNVGKGCVSNRNLPLQNPSDLPTVPWEQLQILTNVSEIIKISDTTEIRTRTYCLRNFCHYSLRKTTLQNELFFLQIINLRRKITKVRLKLKQRNVCVFYYLVVSSKISIITIF